MGKTAMCLVFVFVFFATAVQNTSAQVLQNETAASIKLSPQYPEGFQMVTATLDAYTLNTTGASIAWFIDGVENIEARNTREITFRVGDLGERLNLRARITPQNGPPVTFEHIIVPARVDLIIESDSLVPLHYKGRALPSNGSTIRVVAFPSNTVNPNDLSYKWTVNGTVLYGGSLIGKNVAEFEAPQRSNVLVTVEVANRSGNPITRKTVQIDISEPELHFYVDNPLRGLSRTVISSPYRLFDDEMTVRAEPYYMTKNIFTARPLLEWKINSRMIENPSSDPQTITLRGDGARGSFNVGFHIRNLDNLLQGVEDGFVVTF